MAAPSSGPTRGLEGVDLIIGGEAWEYKGLEKFTQNTLNGAIEDAIKRNVAKNIVIDARSFAATDEFVATQMNRLWGKALIQRVENIVIYTKDATYIYGRIAP